MSIFEKLFKRNKKAEFDIEKAVGAYLLNLPRCNKDVLIISPEYGETHYKCEILVAAEDLLPWAESHSGAVWSFNQEEQAARKALPIWLRGANQDENSVSSVPLAMYEVLRPYVLNFVSDKSAKVCCLECNTLVSDIFMETLDKKRLGDWSWWIDLWKCSKGHELYYEKHEMHIHRVRN